MKILRQSQIKEAATILKNGGLIAFPTETVFGLGVVYDNKDAYERLVQVKKRPPEKPFTLMLADPEDIEKYAELSSVSKALINAFMPGQFTMITKAKEGLPSWCVSSDGNIGIRIADYPLIRNLIRKTGKPLLVPSANKSGEEPATSAKEAEIIFKNEIDAVIEGFSVSNTPSTIVVVNDKFAEVIREGVITIKDIEKVIKTGENTLTISLASDHAGFMYKEEIKKHLLAKGYEVLDCGTNSEESCDYPIYAKAAATKVAKKEANFGILVCSSGEGIAIAANKVKGIRAGIGYNDEVAKLMRQHNDANMIAFGAKFMTLEDVLNRVDILLSTDFEGGRHQRRVNEIE